MDDLHRVLSDLSFDQLEDAVIDIIGMYKKEIEKKDMTLKNLAKNLDEKESNIKSLAIEICDVLENFLTDMVDKEEYIKIISYTIRRKLKIQGVI